MCVCVCRTKRGKKNDVEAVETRSELHIVTRVESAQNVEKMQFKIHETCLTKKKKSTRDRLSFLSDKLQGGFYLTIFGCHKAFADKLAGIAYRARTTITKLARRMV